MATNNPFTVDGNTFFLYLMDGTVGSAAKKDNAEGTASRDLVEVGTLTSGTGQTTPTSDGTYIDTNTANQYLTVTDANLSGIPTGAQTWEMWVNTNSHTLTNAEFIFSKNGATAGPYIALLTDGTLDWRFNASDWVSNGTLSQNAWHYIALVFNPSTETSLYIDGALDKQVLAGVPATSNSNNGIDLGIFAQVSSAGTASNTYNGAIDCFKLSTVALTGTQISDYYNSSAATAFRDARKLNLLGVG